MTIIQYYVSIQYITSFPCQTYSAVHLT